MKRWLILVAVVAVTALGVRAAEAHCGKTHCDSVQYQSQTNYHAYAPPAGRNLSGQYQLAPILYRPQLRFRRWGLFGRRAIYRVHWQPYVAMPRAGQ